MAPFIVIYLRIRKMFDNEQLDAAHRERSYKLVENRVVSMLAGDATKNFKFEYVFGEDTKQTDVFSKLLDLVDNALNGVNGSVILYGQTGSGKTHTMTGGPRKQDGVL